MMHPHRTAVVVSAHRPYATTDSCLSGFCSIVDRKEDFIFVNNGSSESLRRLVSEISPGITVLNLPQNRFFCAGYNAGIRDALEKGYDFVLLANADTEVVNFSFIDGLLEVAQRRPNAAFIGPLVYYRNTDAYQNTRFSFPSVAHNVAAWIPWRLFPSLRHHPPLREEEVDFLNGVCVLCRCAALRDFGLMDEQFGGYIEDADWGWRARQKGWSSVFVPIPSIIHHEEQQGYEHFSFKTFLLKRNTVLWHLKAGQSCSALLYAAASLALIRLRMLRAGKSERDRHLRFFRNLSRSYKAMLGGSRRICSSGAANSPGECGMEIWQ
jgi:GT2 family glycosyltransferase